MMNADNVNEQMGPTHIPEHLDGTQVPLYDEDNDEEFHGLDAQDCTGDEWYGDQHDEGEYVYEESEVRGSGRVEGPVTTSSPEGEQPQSDAVRPPRVHQSPVC